MKRFFLTILVTLITAVNFPTRTLAHGLYLDDALDAPFWQQPEAKIIVGFAIVIIVFGIILVYLYHKSR